MFANFDDEERQLALSGVVQPGRFRYNRCMQNLFRVVLLVSILLPAHQGVAAEIERYTKVANQFVQLINAGDYSGFEKLFDDEMSKFSPLNKTTDFFKGMTSQFGKIQKLDEPKRNGEWMVFPAHCERGLLDMSLALDGENKISGFIFRPHTASADPAASRQETS